MDQTERRRDDLAGDLGDAIARRTLELHFQPFFEIRRHRLRGFEALARWNHPSHGWVPSEAFVPIAEASGLVSELGSWVLGQACTIAQAWSEPLLIAVNISPIRLQSDGFAQEIADILSRTGLSPDRLELEITENVLIDDVEAVIGRLHDLRKAGIRIALDDFGTGFSSLSYLRRLPLDKIKIDQSFVQAMPDDQVSEAIVRAVVKIGRLLGATTTGEGVETERQMDMLRLAGCDEAQGFLLGAPSLAATRPDLGRSLSPEQT